MKNTTRLKLRLVVGVFWGLYCSGFLLAGSGSVRATVEKIVDGDTVWLQPSRSWGGPADELSPDNLISNGAATRIKIRMLSIDAPELHLPTQNYGVVGQSPWGELATEYLKKIIDVGFTVAAQTWGKDKYGRELGFVVHRNRDANLTMVRGGYAVPYIICSGWYCNSSFIKQHRVAEYFSACAQARSKHRGIFNSSKPLREMPFEFRLRMGDREPDKYVGNFETMELFKPEDYKRVDLCRRVFFMKAGDAQKLGFDWASIYR